ncbi:MAG: hypothetical protein V4558_03615 [Gemmatimonadota bacterium]
MRKLPVWLGVACAIAAGSVIGHFDSQPTWDDTGVTVGAVLLSSLVLAAMQPRWAWLIGLGVGVPVLVMNVMATGSYASIAAVGFALLGAGIGYLVGRGLSTAGPQL